MSFDRTKLAYLAGFAPVFVFMKLAGLLPFRARVWLGGFILAGIMRWFPPLRNRVLHNLQIVRPGVTRTEGLRLSADIGRRLGRSITEILFGESFQKHHGELRPSGPGLEAVLQAHATGQPVVLVSGHFGQWDAVRIYLRQEHGINCGAIYRPNNNPYYDPFFVRGAEASGTPLVPKTIKGLRKLFKHLRAGGTFAFLADQVYHEGRRIPFLGEEALTTTSPADLALKFKGLLVPAYSVRRDRERAFDIIFEEPIPHSDPETMMRTFNDSASRMIEKHPDQWLWLHRRWKG
jgi:KDO2-lipid IV(A) lauroyltransferase